MQSPIHSTIADLSAELTMGNPISQNIKAIALYSVQTKETVFTQ
ncbi:MAG: hypothetical protein VKL41_09355 [Snowella sp.]|nr:hypothetical protein [Snowella sp.]